MAHQFWLVISADLRRDLEGFHKRREMIAPAQRRTRTPTTGASGRTGSQRIGTNVAPVRRVLKVCFSISITVSPPEVRMTGPDAASCIGIDPCSRGGQLMATSTHTPTASGRAARKRNASGDT
jgi:hypothetical protein